MKTRLAFLLLLVGSSSAVADPDDQTSTMQVRGSEPFVVVSRLSTDNANAHIGIDLEAARRFGDSRNAFLHAAVAVGRSDDERAADVPVKGAFEEVRVGFELRSTDRLVRVFGGIDLGVQADHRDRHANDVVMTELKTHFVTMPRFGVEAGSRIRVRAAIGLMIREQLSGPDDRDYVNGGAFDIGLGYGF